jgi:hypothetical protein
MSRFLLREAEAVFMLPTVVLESPDMRMLVLFVCALAAWAATPLNGTWKLDRGKSSLNEPPPSFIRNGAMSFHPSGTVAPAVPPATFIVRDGNGGKLYRVGVSSDMRILTLTRILSFEDQSGKQFHALFVLEKQ